MQKIPEWITQRADGAFVVDSDKAYPAIFDKLEVAGIKLPDQPVDRYWVECAYQIAKLTVQELFADTELDPRLKTPPMGFIIVIDASEGRKDRWALSGFKPGRGDRAASKGLEAKAHFARIRGRLLAG